MIEMFRFWVGARTFPCRMAGIGCIYSVSMGSVCLGVCSLTKGLWRVLFPNTFFLTCSFLFNFPAAKWVHESLETSVRELVTVGICYFISHVCRLSLSTAWPCCCWCFKMILELAWTSWGYSWVFSGKASHRQIVLALQERWINRFGHIKNPHWLYISVLMYWIYLQCSWCLN